MQPVLAAVCTVSAETETVVSRRREKVVPTCAPISCCSFVVKLVFVVFPKGSSLLSQISKCKPVFIRKAQAHF